VLDSRWYSRHAENASQEQVKCFQEMLGAQTVRPENIILYLKVFFAKNVPIRISQKQLHCVRLVARQTQITLRDRIAISLTITFPKTCVFRTKTPSMSSNATRAQRLQHSILQTFNGLLKE